MQEFRELLSEWESFYLLIGTAGATLAGLMFVSITITERMANAQRMPMMRAHIDPALLAFILNLVLGALFLMPSLTPFAFGAVLVLISILGLLYSTTVLRQQIRAGVLNGWDFSDRVWYGVAPTLSGLLLLISGSLGLLHLAHLALTMIGVTLIFLLVMGIRNAWDLVTFSIVRRPQNPMPEDEQPENGQQGVQPSEHP